MPNTLALADFSYTGWQDCNNAMSIDEFMPRDAEIEACSVPMLAHACVWRVVGEWTPAEWIASQDSDAFEGLDPVACFAAWRNSWARTAIEIMTAEITERKSWACEVCGGINRGHTCCP